MDAPVVGSSETWQLMRTAQRLTNSVSTGYGLGLFITRYRGVDIVSHPGSWTGSNAQMIKVPAAGLDVVVLVNRYDVSSVLLTDKILDACLPSLEPAPTSPKRPFTNGLFRSPTTGLVIQLYPKDGEQIVAINGMDLTGDFDQEGHLRPSGTFGYVKQTLVLRGDPERPASIEISDFGNHDELLALQPSKNAAPGEGMRGKAKAVATLAIEGQYQSYSTGVTADIHQNDSGPRLIFSGRWGTTIYELERLAEDIWHAKQAGVIPWGGIVTFDQDRSAFRFSSFYTWSLPFQRCS